MKKKKLIVIVTFGLIASLVIVGFFLKNLFKSENGNDFEFSEIKKGNLENIVTSSGTLSAVETVEVGSQVSGIIEKLFVDFNASVEKGQVLAILDKTLFEVSVKDAEARVAQARASLEQAEAEVKRNQPLFEKGHVSEMEFLVIKTNAQTARANLQIAEATLNKANTNLEYTVIRSPIDGTVIERTVDAGQTIAASFQAPKLFVIAKDLTQMQIEAKVDESDIGQIKVNQPVRFTVQTYSERDFSGNVRQIRLQPETIQNVVNYTVIVDAPNRERILLPGMTATIDFLLEQVTGALLVSNQALNFTPPPEMTKNIFEKQTKNNKNQESESEIRSRILQSQGGIGSGNPYKLPDDVGRFFYQDTDGHLESAFFKKGVTDGMFTEIKKVLKGKLRPGTRAIVAFNKDKKPTVKNKNTLLPRPPGRGPM